MSGQGDHGAPMRLVFIGLSISSSWGNGHATTYRGLLRSLAQRGHDVLFLERDVPWYASNRDMPTPPFGRFSLYSSLEELKDRFGAEVREADAVIVGSFVPEGVAVGEWVLATASGASVFYDIDTPVTLRKLANADHEYLSPQLIPRYDMYLSFTGGPMLESLGRDYGARNTRPLYCSVDPTEYFTQDLEERWHLGYLGTYSADRQHALEQLLVWPARHLPQARFAVAGAMYPDGIEWPANIDRMTHVAPPEHRAFYGGQRFTLNLTRADMRTAGHSPSVRLFEAAACGVPIITDEWPGLDELFVFGREILIARNTDDVIGHLRMSDAERRALTEHARRRVLAEHTSEHRAVSLEMYLTEAAFRGGGVKGVERSETCPESL